MSDPTQQVWRVELGGEWPPLEVRATDRAGAVAAYDRAFGILGLSSAHTTHRVDPVEPVAPGEDVSSAAAS
jgi:hypothetical protein